MDLVNQAFLILMGTKGVSARRYTCHFRALHAKETLDSSNFGEIEPNKYGIKHEKANQFLAFAGNPPGSHLCYKHHGVKILFSGCVATSVIGDGMKILEQEIYKSYY